MEMKELTEELPNKSSFQVTKMPGTTNGLTIVTASPLVSGRTFFIHKVASVKGSNFINEKNDLITKIGDEETNEFNHSEFKRAFLATNSYSFVRFLKKFRVVKYTVFSISSNS